MPALWVRMLLSCVHPPDHIPCTNRSSVIKMPLSVTGNLGQPLKIYWSSPSMMRSLFEMYKNNTSGTASIHFACASTTIMITFPINGSAQFTCALVFLHTVSVSEHFHFDQGLIGEGQVLRNAIGGLQKHSWHCLSSLIVSSNYLSWSPNKHDNLLDVSSTSWNGFRIIALPCGGTTTLDSWRTPAFWMINWYLFLWSCNEVLPSCYPSKPCSRCWCTCSRIRVTFCHDGKLLYCNLCSVHGFQQWHTLTQ